MNDEKYYEKVAEELRHDKPKQGLWLKCLTETHGDENKAKILYVKSRVQQLMERDRLLYNERRVKHFREEAIKKTKTSGISKERRLLLIIVGIIIYIAIMILISNNK